MAILPLARLHVERHDPCVQMEILVYDGFDELDAIGPFEVLAPLAPQLVTLEPASSITASQGLILTPHGTLSQAPDLLVVPGGGWVSRNEHAGAYAEYRRGAIPAAIAARHARGTIVASVCTGALLLAAAGILHGRPAVTHRTAFDDLRALGVDVRTEARWVDAGSVLSAAGVTSGIDLALHLLERFAGAEVAVAAARRLEHARLDLAPALA